jgi:hypothetical protein
MVKSYLPREQRIKTAGPDVKVLRATSGPERIVKALRGDRKPEGLADGRHRSRKKKRGRGNG